MEMFVGKRTAEIVVTIVAGIVIAFAILRKRRKTELAKRLQGSSET